jgi:26S proteasome regulatory subunit N7
MKAFPGVAEQACTDLFMHAHFRYFLREARVASYAQFLESYKSVTLPGMAAAFGVSVEFMDSELSQFIAAGRLNCKIDKVAGVLETTRPDTKSSQYAAVIKAGDLLLNRIQQTMRTE